jgi:hypothetical protein
MAVHQLSDMALKRTNVRMGEQVVERSFGSMEIHYRNQSEVLEAGRIMLMQLGAQESDRMACRIAWSEVICAITLDQSADAKGIDAAARQKHVHLGDRASWLHRLCR